MGSEMCIRDSFGSIDAPAIGRAVGMLPSFRRTSPAALPKAGAPRCYERLTATDVDRQGGVDYLTGRKRCERMQGPVRLGIVRRRMSITIRPYEENDEDAILELFGGGGGAGYARLNTPGGGASCAAANPFPACSSGVLEVVP